MPITFIEVNTVLQIYPGTIAWLNLPRIGQRVWPKTKEQEGKEKHVPVLEVKEGKVIVKIGSIPHPMEDNHYIELVQILKGKRVIAEKRLYPGEEPKVEFCLDETEGIAARELCNIHGLWAN